MSYVLMILLLLICICLITYVVVFLSLLVLNYKLLTWATSVMYLLVFYIYRLISDATKGATG